MSLRSRLFQPRVFLLTLRRTLDLPLVLWFATSAAFLLAQDWAPPNALLDVHGDPTATESTAAGLTRQGLWGGLALAIGPLLVLRAATTIAHWRRGEIDLFASRAAGRAAWIVSTWIGQCAAATILLSLCGVLAAARAGSTLLALEPAGSAGTIGADWITSEEPASSMLGTKAIDAPAGSRLQVELAPQGAPAIEAELCVRAGMARASCTNVRIATRAAIDVALARERGPLALEIRCLTPGARLRVLSRDIELWIPSASLAVDVRMAARLLLASFTWLALALGLGAWLSPSISALATLAVWIIALLGPRACTLLPGGDLLDALEVIGRGRAPAAVDAMSLLLALGLCMLGILLGTLGLSQSRRQA